MSGVTGRVMLMFGRGRPSEGESEVDESAARAVEAGRDRTLPRWLDPSLAAARSPHVRASAVMSDRRAATAPTRAPMVFVARREELGGLHQVRYDGVPLLDRPDDVLGLTMQELDAGDEVDVLERAEIWTRVRTPDNLVGWVPGMTLAVVSGDQADPRSSTDLDVPEAGEEPIALEALLAAVAAQRLALRQPPPEAAPAPPPASPRRRTRKPKVEAPPAEAAIAEAPPAEALPAEAAIAEAPPAEAPPTSKRRRSPRPKAIPAQET